MERSVATVEGVGAPTSKYARSVLLLIVLVSTLANAGAWREFKLITPPRIPEESL